MQRDLKNWILLIFLSLTWGSSFILMKKGMYAGDGSLIFTDRQVAGMRMLIAGVVLAPFAFRYLRRLLLWKDLIRLSVVGFFGSFIPAFLFTYAETGVSSGYAGMLNSCTPIFALVLGFAVFRNKLGLIQIAGVILGTVGIVLLTVAGNDFSLSSDWKYVMAILVATLFYGISINTIKYTLPHVKSIELTALSFFLLIVPSIVSFVHENTWHVITVNPNAMSGLFYIGILSIVGTAFAVIIYTGLIAKSSILFASSVTYLIPIFAVIMGLLANESISVLQIGAMLVVLTGVFVANYLPKILEKKHAK